MHHIYLEIYSLIYNLCFHTIFTLNILFACLQLALVVALPLFFILFLISGASRFPTFVCLTCFQSTFVVVYVDELNENVSVRIRLSMSVCLSVVLFIVSMRLFSLG